MSDTQYVDAQRLSYGNTNDQPLRPNVYSPDRTSRVYGDSNGVYGHNRATSWDNNQRMDSDLSKHTSFATANGDSPLHGRQQSALYGTGNPTSPMLDGQTPMTGQFARDESPMNHKVNSTEKASKEIPGAGAYYAMSGILGFKEKQSLVLCEFSRPPCVCAHAHAITVIVFGGALLGYCCYEMQALGDKHLAKFTKPGACAPSILMYCPLTDLGSRRMVQSRTRDVEECVQCTQLPLYLYVSLASEQRYTH